MSPKFRSSSVDTGRYGKKARAVDLTHQLVVGDSPDMGVASGLLPHDLPNVQVGSPGTGEASDPEAAPRVVDAVIRLLISCSTTLAPGWMTDTPRHAPRGQLISRGDRSWSTQRALGEPRAAPRRDHAPFDDAPL